MSPQAHDGFTRTWHAAEWVAGAALALVIVAAALLTVDPISRAITTATSDDLAPMARSSRLGFKP